MAGCLAEPPDWLPDWLPEWLPERLPDRDDWLDSESSASSRPVVSASPPSAESTESVEASRAVELRSPDAKDVTELTISAFLRWSRWLACFWQATGVPSEPSLQLPPSQTVLPLPSLPPLSPHTSVRPSLDTLLSTCAEGDLTMDVVSARIECVKEVTDSLRGAVGAPTL